MNRHENGGSDGDGRDTQGGSALDLFISYNRLHTSAVLAIVEVLRARGASTFLDRDQLTPGLPWPQALEAGLGRVRAVAVFVGPGGFGDWQRREMYFALERQVVASRQGRVFPVIPVLLPGAELAPAFLFQNTWIDFRAGVENPGALDALLAAATTPGRAPPRPPSDTCPYVALRAFREEDASFFFGRTTAIQDTVDALRHGVAAIVAPSGFGKSSVLLAGVVPRLRRSRPPDPTWDIATFTPRTNPWLGLADALLPFLQDTTEARRVEEAAALARGLSQSRDALALVVGRILERSRGTDRFLLGIDQFEELFTQVPETEREAFLDAVFTAAKASPLTVVLTLRADFYGVALNTSTELAYVLNSAQVALGPLGEDELRTTIEGPARLAGLDFEPGLIDAILDDIRGQKGSLPLLEYALTALWQASRGTPTLTHQAYDAIGGVERAISTSAERVYEALSRDDQRAARRLFGRLVRVSGHDEEGTDTRRRATRAEAGEQAWAVAELFAARDRRLLVLSTSHAEAVATVEVAHEAIIRTWDRLRGWLKEDRDFLLWRQQLGYLLGPWRASRALMAPELVPDAARWLSERAADLTDEERTFITESVEASGRRKRLPVVVTAAAVAAFVLVGAGVWTLQRTFVHLDIDFGADDRVVVRPALSWMSALPWVGNRVLLDTGLERADILQQNVIGLSQRDTDAASGRILERAEVHDALADTLNGVTLRWVLADDAAARVAGLQRALRLKRTVERLDEHRSLLRRMMLDVARNSPERLQETLEYGDAYLALSEAVGLDPALGTTAAEAMIGRGETLLTFPLAARSLAYVAAVEPRVAQPSARALFDALVSPADATSGGLVEGNRAEVAGSLVLTWKAMSAAGMSIDPMSIRRSRAADWLLWELEHGYRTEDEDVLGELLLLDPSLVSEPVTWTQRPSVAGDIEAVSPSARATIRQRIVRLLNPAVPSEDADERAESAARVLGYAAVARPDLAPSIADALLASLERTGQLTTTGVEVALGRLVNAQPRLAQTVFPRVAGALSHADVSVKWQAIGVVAAVVSADSTLAARASQALFPMLTDRASVDANLTGRISDALGRIVRADRAAAAPLAGAVLEMLRTRPHVAGADVVVAALTDALGPVDSRALVKPLAEWMVRGPAYATPVRSPSAIAALMRAAPDLCRDAMQILSPGLADRTLAARAAIALGDIASAGTGCTDAAVDLLVLHAGGVSDQLHLELAYALARASAFGSRPIHVETWQRSANDRSEDVRAAARLMLANTIRRDAARAAMPAEVLLAHFEGRASLLDGIGVNAITHAAYRKTVSDAIAQWMFSGPEAHGGDRQALAQQLERVYRSDRRPYLRVAALETLARADQLRALSVLQNRAE